MGKKKSTRSVGSSNSKNSSSTQHASNVSSSSSVSTTKSGKSKKPNSSKRKSKNKAELPPTTPPRERVQSDPVDLDNMVDTLNRSHEMGGDISPAETFDTVPLSESPSRSFDSSRSASQPKRKDGKSRLRSKGVDDSHSNDYLPATLLNFDSPNGKSQGNGNGTSKVVIEHKIKDSNNKGGSRSGVGGCGTYMCLLKPLLLFLFLATILAGAASVYGWLFKFPDLNKQVRALESEISRLESENDRYERLNNQLNITVDDLEDVRDDLNGTAAELEGVASALNTTKDQIVLVIEELKESNEAYAEYNQGLQANVAQLGGEVAFFKEALEELSAEHSILKTTTTALQDLANTFSSTTIEQGETVAVLKETLEAFQAENDRLEDFNEKLESGLNYLNETLFANGNIVESSAATLSDISEALGERVQQQQRSTLQQLEISYRQLLTAWDCDYRDVFRSEPFGQDFDAVISGVPLPADVRTYLDDRVLSRMCLDLQDFEEYLSSTVAGGVTSNQLIRAVVLYTEDAMQYFFDGSEIPMSEWIDAGFRCDLLESPFEGQRSLAVADNDISVRRNLRHGTSREE